MKKLCWVITTSAVALLWIFAVVFFVLTDLQMLEHEEFLNTPFDRVFNVPPERLRRLSAYSEPFWAVWVSICGAVPELLGDGI